MPTARGSDAPSFRRECIVYGCAVCIIRARTSLPSLKMPTIRTQLIIYRSKSRPARLRHRRSCVRRTVWRCHILSPSVSSSAFSVSFGVHASNKNPTVVMIVGFFVPSASHPVFYPRCWNRRRINVHIGWVSFAHAPMVATVQSVWGGFQTRAKIWASRFTAAKKPDD